MKIQKGAKWVMMGDSVTDAGCAQPVGEGLFDPYGRGYVNFVNALLGAVYPEQKIRVVNMGRSGNTARELKNRWQKDVFDLKPDWVSIMIGINDVWRQFDVPLKPEDGVPLGEYEKNLRELIEQTLPRVKGLILATPYIIEPNKNEPMRKRMDQYGAVVKKLAKEYKTLFVDTQAAFDDVLAEKMYHPMALAWDRIHPNQPGHMIIAKAFLDAIGFKW